MSELEYFIVEGGHDDDPDPQEAGRVRLRNMAKHGRDVKTEHLPFSQMISPTGTTAFNRPPQPGSIVVGYTPRGAGATGYSHILGIVHGIHKKDASIPGNDRLPFLDIARDMESKINIPPDIQNMIGANRSGIERMEKELKEKGQHFKQALLLGLQSHGAEYALAGIRNTPLKQISTALEAGTSILNSGMLSGLASTALNMSSILNNLDLQSLSSELQTTAQNFFGMLQSDIVSGHPDIGAMFGNQVDMTQMISNIQDALKSVSSHDELVSTLRNIQSPEFIAAAQEGLDQLEIEIETAFGTLKQKLNVNGEIEDIASDIIQSLLSAFSSLIGSIESGGPGKKLFTETGTAMKELADRMTDISKATEITRFMERLSNANNSHKKRGREDGSSATGTTLDILYNIKSLATRNGFDIGFTPK